MTTVPATTPITFTRGGVRVTLLRDSNKPRKLKYNLAAARAESATTLLTFGGAYSNHIRAVAAAGAAAGFATIGVIRGEEHLPLNDSLAEAAAHGMRLTYLDRTTYRAKHTPEVIAALHAAHGDFFLIPEGGSNPAAVRGCAELPAEAEAATGPFDVICCPVGTGGTLAGIAAGLQPGRRAIGFAALKGDFLTGEVAELQRRALGRVTENWTVEDGFHFGGYAKSTAELTRFIDEFEAEFGLRAERVYVAKMLFGVLGLIDAGRFGVGTRIVVVVTSG